MNYLVDSDWIISGVGGRTAALKLLASLQDDGLAISVVTLGEVFDGAFGTTDPVRTIARHVDFLAGFAVLDVTQSTVRVFAELRSSLRRPGNLIPDLDLLIAATALEHGLTLVTRNRRHFARIAGLALH